MLKQMLTLIQVIRNTPEKAKGTEELLKGFGKDQVKSRYERRKVQPTGLVAD